LVELKDDSRDIGNEEVAMAAATYSNNESTGYQILLYLKLLIIPEQ